MKKIIGIFLLSLLFIVSGTSSQPYFQKITTGSIATESGYFVIPAFADYDNDGDLDLVITTFYDGCWSCDFPISQFRNNGDGTFTRITASPITNEVTKSFGACWGDYDNDGLLDLFIAAGFNRNNLLFHNEGGGNFTKITAGAIVNDGGESRGCSWVDYNKDGWIDLFVVNQNNQNDFLYRNNGNGTFTRIINVIIANDNSYGRGCAWGDYDNDGWDDLFITTYQGQHDLLYRNNANGTFTSITNTPVTNDNAWGSTCEWADYDNDADLDLFVTNNTYNNFLYNNTGNGNFVFVNTGLTQENGDFYGVNWGDYDNDGYIDIIVCKAPGTNLFYKNFGSYFVKVTNETPALESGGTPVWVDYDNNGKLDLLYTSTPYNSLFKNTGNTGKYLICKLKACGLNKFALGAKIRIYYGASSQFREVTSNSGDIYWQHFGLGNASTVDSIVVKWPSGNNQKLTGIAANQTIVIDECTIGIINNQIPYKYSLYQNYPNPFNPKTQIEYSLLNSTDVKLILYDLTGKFLQTLVNEYQSQGTYRFEFDGTNYASGTYFYKLETETFISLKKMVLLK